ncbi:hypothetical protein DFH08DRAFT_818756 [Mycena albidolilacea]|uniref:Uncharacterized protein n=1 Tax=Mycena albidolilacea TaxID=1033008 RepID=A0AAD6ZGB9_9AGAR|nr:hypothetical protein DFH08DRAFT_818756 [Mycena albidolilacea]
MRNQKEREPSQRGRGHWQRLKQARAIVAEARSTEPGAAYETAEAVGCASRRRRLLPSANAKARQGAPTSHRYCGPKRKTQKKVKGRSTYRAGGRTGTELEDRNEPEVEDDGPLRTPKMTAPPERKSRGKETHNISGLLPELLLDIETDAGVARPREPAGSEEGPLQKGGSEVVEQSVTGFRASYTGSSLPVQCTKDAESPARDRHPCGRSPPFFLGFGSSQSAESSSMSVGSENSSSETITARKTSRSGCMQKTKLVIHNGKYRLAHRKFNDRSIRSGSLECARIYCGQIE